MRSNIGTLELDTLLSERTRLNERIAAQLGKVAAKWGIQFTRVEIQELKTADATADAMRQQMVAERKRRAIVTEAEGTADAEIRLAEAERNAMILRADGQAKALEAIADAELNYLEKLGKSVGSAEAAQILLAQKYLDGFNNISKNPSHKVFLPNSFSGLFSLPVDDGRTTRSERGSEGSRDTTG